jgi:hypothetical protein
MNGRRRPVNGAPLVRVDPIDSLAVPVGLLQARAAGLVDQMGRFGGR